MILARTLYQKAEIYILDEALSEVDLKTEKTIIKNIRKFLKDKTLIYITHKEHDKLFDNVLKFEGNT